MGTIRFCTAGDEAAADDAAAAGGAADAADGDAATDDAAAGGAATDVVADAVAGVDGDEPVLLCIDDEQPAARLAVTATATAVVVMRPRTSALIDTKRSVGDQHCGAAQQHMADVVEPNAEPTTRHVDDVLATAVAVECGHRGHDCTCAAAA